MTNSKTRILLASATSATGSMRRIFCKLSGVPIENTKFVERYAEEGRIEQLSSAPLPSDGGIYLYNRPPSFNRDIELTRYWFAVNFRDPRDRLCNMFAWVFAHPNRSMTEKDLADYRAKVAMQGIDQWVLAHAQPSYFDNLWWAIENYPQNCQVFSYAQLCLNFDEYIKRACEFLEVPLTNERQALVENERAELLHENPRWIGNKWKSANVDTAPGRYLRELKPSTIEKLNIIYAQTLNKMAKYDAEFAHLYFNLSLI